MLHDDATVHLTREEVEHARGVGLALSARGGRLGPGHGEPGRPRSAARRHHALGSIGEAAACKYKGVPYEPDFSEFGRGDLGDVEIRTTHHSNGCLIVFANDAPEKPCALVVLQMNTDGSATGSVVGWVRAGDARTEANLERAERCTRPGSARQWWVRQCDLTPGLPGDVKGALHA